MCEEIGVGARELAGNGTVSLVTPTPAQLRKRARLWCVALAVQAHVSHVVCARVEGGRV